jgi:hypothetical protein
VQSNACIQASDLMLLLNDNVSVVIKILNELLHKISFDNSIFNFAQLLQ